jgi:RND family efflux transporter MFP subunit
MSAHSSNYRLSIAGTLLALLTFAAGCNRADGEEKLALPAEPPAESMAKTTSQKQPPQVEVGEPGLPAAPRSESMRFTGTTQPIRVSQVAAKGAGLVKRIFVQEGDYVEQGAPIAELDATHAALQKRQAKASIRAARVQVEAAEREQRRMAKLSDLQATPQAQVDMASTSAEAAEAQLELARAGLALATQAEEDAAVVAPFSGVVLDRLKNEGEWVSTMPPAPLIVLAQVEPMEVRVDVPELLRSRLVVGGELTVHLTALGRTEKAVIARIIPEVKPATRTFEVVAHLPNAGRDIPVGSYADVTLEPQPIAKAEGATP